MSKQRICHQTKKLEKRPSTEATCVVRRSFLGGAKAEQNDLLLGLQKLIQAQDQQKPPQTGDLLQSLKAMIRKAEFDDKFDLLEGLRKLVQNETKKRGKKQLQTPQAEPAWNPPDRGVTRWSQRNRGSVAQEWQENLRLSDWDAATSDIGMFKSPDLLGQALDHGAHESYFCHASTLD